MEKKWTGSLCSPGKFGSEWLVFTPGVQDVSILISVFSGEPYLQLRITIQVCSLLDSSLPATNQMAELLQGGE